jgi:UDP-N-acetylglucosamine/UDP-N-acetylgalactosamine 4-epimerase
LAALFGLNQNVIGLDNFATGHQSDLDADFFSTTYGFRSIGLRYFNVFGPRRDPNGPYAAVIPKGIEQIQNRQTVQIRVAGQTSRDFCYVENAIQANLLVARAPGQVKGQVYNLPSVKRPLSRSCSKH